MSRASHILTLAAAAVAFATVTAPAPAASKKVTCTKVRGDTMYRDRTLRVIQKVTRAKADPDASTVTLRFCKPGSTAAPKLLARFSNTLDGSLTVEAVVRGGPRYLALELAAQTGTTDATELFVYNLSTRQRTFAFGSEDGFDYVVTTDGGVALLQAGTVVGYDSTGERPLASGASALAGVENTVYWKIGDAAATATLIGEARRIP